MVLEIFDQISFANIILRYRKLLIGVVTSSSFHQSCNFIKKRPQHRLFVMNFVKFLKAPFCRSPPDEAVFDQHLHYRSGYYDYIWNISMSISVFCKILNHLGAA